MRMCTSHLRPLAMSADRQTVHKVDEVYTQLCQLFMVVMCQLRSAALPTTAPHHQILCFLLGQWNMCLGSGKPLVFLYQRHMQLCRFELAYLGPTVVTHQ